MLQGLLKFALTFILEKLLGLLSDKFDEYKENQELKKEIKLKVKAIKDAKTKEEIRVAVRDLSI
jgi:hypothetical protein